MKLDMVGKSKKVHAGLTSFSFVDDDGHHIAYIPSLNLSGYGDTGREALDMLINVVVKDYFEHLLDLTQHQIMNELRQHGWVRKPYLHKQLRNTKFYDPESIKHDFNLPAETTLHSQFVSV